MSDEVMRRDGLWCPVCMPKDVCAVPGGDSPRGDEEISGYEVSRWIVRPKAQLLCSAI